jgi:hypothetical protein
MVILTNFWIQGSNKKMRMHVSQLQELKTLLHVTIIPLCILRKSEENCFTCVGGRASCGITLYNRAL